MDELKLYVAGNIIKLRTEAGMTQAELGEKLNYSDKTISKWERAESIPDAYVLKRIGELFGVSVDYLLDEHAQWSHDAEESPAAGSYNTAMISLVCIFGIWTLAVLALVIFWLLGDLQLMILAYAVPVTLAAILVLNSIWNRGRGNLFVVAALVLAVVATVYLTFIQHNPWQLFLVLVPAEVVVVLSFRIKK